MAWQIPAAVAIVAVMMVWFVVDERLAQRRRSRFRTIAPDPMPEPPQPVIGAPAPTARHIHKTDLVATRQRFLAALRKSD